MNRQCELRFIPTNNGVLRCDIAFLQSGFEDVYSPIADPTFPYASDYDVTSIMHPSPREHSGSGDDDVIQTIDHALMRPSATFLHRSIVSLMFSIA